MKPKELHIDIAPYRRLCHVIIGSFAQAQRILQKQYGCPFPDDIKEAHGAVWRIEKTKTGASLSILWVDGDYELTYDNVAHEVFHLTKSVMEMSDLPLSNETNEAWAYLNGHLNEVIMQAVFG